MPLYGFKCSKCEEEFEVMLSISQLEAGDVSCPQCGCEDVTQQLSSSLVQGFPNGYKGKVR